MAHVFNTLPARLAALALLVAVTGCRDTAVVSGPATDPAALCGTADCTAFRAISTASARGLVKMASTLAGKLRDQTLGKDLVDRFASLDQFMAAENVASSRLALISALATVDRGIRIAPRGQDAPDLSAIRLNLEPLIMKYGLR